MKVSTVGLSRQEVLRALCSQSIEMSVDHCADRPLRSKLEEDVRQILAAADNNGKYWFASIILTGSTECVVLPLNVDLSEVMPGMDSGFDSAGYDKLYGAGTAKSIMTALRMQNLQLSGSGLMSPKHVMYASSPSVRSYSSSSLPTVASPSPKFEQLPSPPMLTSYMLNNVANNSLVKPEILEASNESDTKFTLDLRM